MIFYFSATGNSEWAAETLARLTSDTAVSIADVVKGRVPAPGPVGDVLGIVFPVHSWAVPRYVTDFVDTLDILPGTFVYAVATCQSEVGAAFTRLRAHVRLDGRYVLCMPNNFAVWGLGRDNRAKDRAIISKAAG